MNKFDVFGVFKDVFDELEKLNNKFDELKDKLDDLDNLNNKSGELDKLKD